MKVKTSLVLSGEELCTPFIAETFSRGSRPTQTMRGKRIFRSMFTEEEQNKCKELVIKAKTWKQSTIVELSVEEYDLWRRLLEYCRKVA